MNIDTVVSKLKENDEKLEELKNEKKQIDEEIKLLEEGLIQYCKDNNMSIEHVTKGSYDLKPTTGRKFKKKN